MPQRLFFLLNPPMKLVGIFQPKLFLGRCRLQDADRDAISLKGSKMKLKRVFPAQ